MNGPIFKKYIIVHPFLIGVYFVLDNFATVANYVPLREIALPLLVILLFIICLWMVLKLFIKDTIKSGIAISIILVPLLFYYKFFTITQDHFPALARDRYLEPFFFICVVGSLYIVLNTRKKLVYSNSLLNTLTACYVFYGIFLVASHIKPYDNSLELELHDQKSAMESTSSTNSNTRPDIYYIVVDSYTSSDSLKRYFDYDNSDFIKNLTRKGFYIAEKSRAFYPSTVHSIASTLNMTNKKELRDKPPEILYKIIENSVVVGYLCSKSYEVVNLSIFKLYNSPKFYDSFFISLETPWSFQDLFLKTAIFRIVVDMRCAVLYKINLRIIDELKKIPHKKDAKPRFIYAHLILPHFPYSFDSKGNVIPWFKRKSMLDKRAYISQLEFTNQVVLDLIDTILAKSEKKPIIIIQGDHGFRNLRNNFKKTESLTILNAYYLPDGGDKLLYDSIAPYNSFRVIFNRYFGTRCELLNE